MRVGAGVLLVLMVIGCLLRILQIHLSAKFNLSPLSMLSGRLIRLFIRRDFEAEAALAWVRAEAVRHSLPDVPCWVFGIRRWILRGGWAAQSIPKVGVILARNNGPYGDFDRDSLRVVIAHEWGHVLNFCSTPDKHLIMHYLWPSDMESYRQLEIFADGIAVYLCGQEMVLQAKRRAGLSHTQEVSLTDCFEDV